MKKRSTGGRSLIQERKLIFLLFVLFFAVILSGAASAATSNSFTSNKKVVSNVPGKDLVVSSISIPTRGVQGKTFKAINTITNQGYADTGAFLVHYYLIQSSTSTTYYFIGSRYIKYLRRGNSDVDNTVLYIPKSVRTGNYHVMVIVDSSNDVIESNEANNIRFSVSRINISPYPITIDSYKKEFDPEVTTDYYMVTAKQTAVDTMVVHLVNYSSSGVFHFSGYVTIHKIGSNQISEKTQWGPPYNSNTYEVHTSTLTVKQYYYYVWQPNLFR